MISDSKKSGTNFLGFLVNILCGYTLFDTSSSHLPEGVDTPGVSAPSGRCRAGSCSSGRIERPRTSSFLYVPAKKACLTGELLHTARWHRGGENGLLGRGLYHRDS